LEHNFRICLIPAGLNLRDNAINENLYLGVIIPHPLKTRLKVRRRGLGYGILGARFLP
jgi:hypothetical protein